MKKLYVLYDERARLGDTDDASVLETSDSKPTYTPKAYGEHSIWAEYTLEKDGTYGKERLMWEI